MISIYLTWMVLGLGVMAGPLFSADSDDADKTRPESAPLREWDESRAVNLVPTSEKEYQGWRYTTVEPEGDWTSPAYNDAAWLIGNGMFGTGGTPALRLGTEWATSDIYMRRTFELEAIPLMIALRMLHDDAVTVYINGKCVVARPRYIRKFKNIPVEGRPHYLKLGRNTIAVHCHQEKEGQSIDVGILGMMEQALKKP